MQAMQAAARGTLDGSPAEPQPAMPFAWPPRPLVKRAQLI